MVLRLDDRTSADHARSDQGLITTAITSGRLSVSLFLFTSLDLQ